MGEDASAVMRRAALLLLLLVLPGLLLPAGAWWRVCGCAVPMSARAPSCCAPDAAAADAAPSCCGSDHGARAALPALAHDDCRCEWLPLPDLGDDAPAVPPAADGPPALPPRVRLAVAPLALANQPAPRAWSPRQQRPPPHPFAARNLPLRI
jgi:hypothetical protein